MDNLEVADESAGNTLCAAGAKLTGLCLHKLYEKSEWGPIFAFRYRSTESNQQIRSDIRRMLPFEGQSWVDDPTKIAKVVGFIGTERGDSPPPSAVANRIIGWQGFSVRSAYFRGIHNEDAVAVEGVLCRRTSQILLYFAPAFEDIETIAARADIPGDLSREAVHTWLEQHDDKTVSVAK